MKRKRVTQTKIRKLKRVVDHALKVRISELEKVLEEGAGKHAPLCLLTSS